MPKRIPKHVVLMVATEGNRTRWLAVKTTKWLHAINGDPKLGREKKEIRKEIYGDEDGNYETQDMSSMRGDKDTQVTKEIEVEIESPKLTGMPRTYLDGLSNVEFRIANQVSQRLEVASRWEVVGTHSGTLLGRPATGADVTVAGVTILKFAETTDEDEEVAYKATEDWTCWDLPSTLRQIGAAP